MHSRRTLQYLLSSCAYLQLAIKRAQSEPILSTVSGILSNWRADKPPSRKKAGVTGKEQVVALSHYTEEVRREMNKPSPGKRNLPTPEALVSILGMETIDSTKDWIVSVPQLARDDWRRHLCSQLSSILSSILIKILCHMRRRRTCQTQLFAAIYCRPLAMQLALSPHPATLFPCHPHGPRSSQLTFTPYLASRLTFHLFFCYLCRHRMFHLVTASAKHSISPCSACPKLCPTTLSCSRHPMAARSLRARLS